MYVYNYLICAISQVVMAAFIWHSAYMDERRNRLYVASIIFNVLTLLGYAIHIPGEDFQSTLHRADENMYKVKVEYYERTGKTRRE